MSSIPESRASWISEFGPGLPTLLVASFAMTVSMPSISLYTLAYFIPAWHDEFGWSRQDIGVCASFLSLAIFAGGPWIGRLCDRFGVRRVAPLSVILYALGLAALRLVVRDLWVLYGMFFAIGILGGGASHIAYLRAVAPWFNRYRGMALGITATGPGLMAALAPQFLPNFIATHGWRAGWLLLAGIALSALPMVLLLPRKPRALATIRASTTPEGATVSQARGTLTFWLMLVGLLLLGTGLVGLMTQLAPIVNEIKASTTAGIAAASAFGLSIIAGRLLTGVLLDRLPARAVASVVFLSPTIGIVTFLSGAPLGPTLLGIGLGLAAGAENDVVGYLVSRYFGMHSYAEIFGWMYGTLGLGAAAGPFLIRLVQMLGVHHRGVLLLSAVMCAAAAVCYASLGPYRTLRPTTATLLDPTS